MQLDFTVWCTPQSLTPQWDAQRGAWICSGMNTAESDYMVGSTLWSSTLQCDAHCRVFWEIWCSWLRGVMNSAHCGTWLQSGIHTAELDSAVGSTLRSLTQWRDAHWGVKRIKYLVFSFLCVNYVFQQRFTSEVGVRTDCSVPVRCVWVLCRTTGWWISEKGVRTDYHRSSSC